MRISTLFSNSLPIWLVATTAFLVGGSLLVATSTEARPKRSGPAGQTCTAKRVTSAGGSKCIDKAYKRAIERGRGMHRGLINNWSWMLLCLPNGQMDKWTNAVLQARRC
jgi:hypothetical protein